MLQHPQWFRLWSRSGQLELFVPYLKLAVATQMSLKTWEVVCVVPFIDSMEWIICSSYTWSVVCFLRQALLKSIGRGIASSFLALQIFGAIGCLADDRCCKPQHQLLGASPSKDHPACTPLAAATALHSHLNRLPLPMRCMHLCRAVHKNLSQFLDFRF